MQEDLFNERLYCGETGAEGSCSFDPSFLAISEAMIYYAKALAFYLLKFRSVQYFQTGIELKLIEILSSMVVNADFNAKEFEYVMLAMRNKILEYEVKYKELFKQESPKFVTGDTARINDIIKNGVQEIVKKNLNLKKDVRDLHAIIVHLIRSMCVHINEIFNYRKDVEQYVTSVLEMLDMLNEPNLTAENLLSGLKIFCKKHYELIGEIDKVLKEYYGPCAQTEVSKDEIAGPAILVSGHNYFELEQVLKLTADTDINVYTHDGLINAHSFEKFQRYSNLVGHYQKYLYSSSCDFASFGGTIFITNTPMDEFDSFVRGRIFTTSLFAGIGITKIFDNNFTPMLEMTMQTRGFEKYIQHPSVSIGYISKNVDSIIYDLREKFERKIIDKIFILKIDRESMKTKNELDKFVNSIPRNVFVFATFDIERENFMKIDAFYDYGIIFYCLDKIKDIFEGKDLPINLFVSHCNIHTLSYLITLSFIGIKNIYLANCSYFTINPTIIDSVQKFFGIKQLSKLLTSSVEDIQKELY